MQLRTLAIAVSVALVGKSASVVAGGFALIEQNASGLGNAYAGQAAASEDASTIYFNPAGMTRLPGGNVVVVGHLIKPSANFNNSGSTPAVSTVLGAGPYAMNGNGGDAGDLAVAPNVYLAWQLNRQWFVGVGVSAPFGLKTEYDSNWMGRFHALKSDVKTVNVNPSIAFKASDAVSIGFGLNWQRVEAELTKATNYSFVASAGGIPGVPNNSEGTNRIEGDDSTWGFNIGLLFKAGPNTDVGLAYRSEMRYTLSGTATFNGRPAAVNAVLSGAFGAAAATAAQAQVGDSNVTAALDLPASFSMAIKHRMGGQWELLADATWTEWSSLQQLNIVRDTGVVLENTPFKWRDTWRVGLGGNYRFNDAWTLRFGVAYDQTPTRDEYRTPRVPDSNRRWVSGGGQYRISKAAAIDFGYARLFMSDTPISLTGAPALSAAQAAGRGNLVGKFDDKVDILSIQYRHAF